MALSKRRGAGVALGICRRARTFFAFPVLDQAIAQRSRYSADPALMGEISRFSIGTVCDKRELFWPRRVINLRPLKSRAFSVDTSAVDREHPALKVA